LPPALKLLRALYPIIELLIPPLAKKIGIGLFLKPFRFAAPEREKDVALKARNTSFGINGQKVEVYHWGNGQRYALCVHGWSGRATQFHALIESLLKNGISVIAFDAPAHGKSTGPRTNLIEFAESIKQIIEEHGEPMVLIGHSLGGIAGMLYQRMHNTSIPQITINSPAIVDEIFENYAYRLNARKEKIAKWIKDYVQAKINKEFYEVSGEYLSKGFPNVPFLICMDEDDREVSMRNAEVLKQNIPSAEIFTTSTYGHVRILRAEVLALRVMEFVARLQPVPNEVNN